MRNSICILLIFFLFTNLSIPTFAISRSTSINNTMEQTVTIYNGDGELINEMTLFQFEKLQDSKTSASVIIKAMIKALGVVDSISFASESLTGISIAGWIYDNITLPIYNTVKQMHIYSRDGTVFNPYPSHSYEGTMWKKNNFYVVVIN